MPFFCLLFTKFIFFSKNGAFSPFLCYNMSVILPGALGYGNCRKVSLGKQKLKEPTNKAEALTVRMKKEITYMTRGTCSRQINVQIEDGIIRSVQFVGGCNGNTKGISALVQGMKAEDVVKRLKGTDCAGRGPSCPDQLAHAIEEAIKDNDR